MAFDPDLFYNVLYYFVVEEPRRRSMSEDDDQFEDDEVLDSNEVWEQLVVKMAQLMVTFGLLNSIINQYPPHVKDGLVERMQAVIKTIEREVEIVEGFGEAFDG